MRSATRVVRKPRDGRRGEHAVTDAECSCKCCPALARQSCAVATARQLRLSDVTPAATAENKAETWQRTGHGQPPTRLCRGYGGNAPARRCTRTTSIVLCRDLPDC